MIQMKFFKRIFLFVSWLWTRWLDSNTYAEPKKFGTGPHDCALVALYAVVPHVSEDELISAFMHCAESWPYAGVTNKEFNITVNYLGLKFEYDASDGQTVGNLAGKRDERCVALLYGHFIAMRKGRIVGRDTNMFLGPETKVYCSWRFF